MVAVKEKKKQVIKGQEIEFFETVLRCDSCDYSVEYASSKKDTQMIRKEFGEY